MVKNMIYLYKMNTKNREVQYPIKIIPHKTPINMSHKKWHRAYHDQIVYMFQTTADILSKELSMDNSDIYTKKNFLLFSRMLYDSSSGYITPY